MAIVLANHLVSKKIREIKTVDTFLNKKFKPKDGPHYQTLSQSLDQLNVQRQAYHGGSFVGNHVHKLLKVSTSHTHTYLPLYTFQPASVDTLLSGISNESSNPNLLIPCQEVVDKFREVFRLFATCHNTYNGRVTDDEEIKQLGTLKIIINNPNRVRTMVPFYRERQRGLHVLLQAALPQYISTTLLEDHMVGWLKLYHLAPGLMGEQGAESIHAHLNRLETTYNGIANPVERLKYVFNMYIIETTPSLQILKPPVKTRKRKRATS